MLKKAVVLYLLGLVGIFAVDIYTMNNEPGKLYVATGNVMLSSTAQLEKLLANRGGNGLTNSKSWRGYLGITEIREDEFFKVAGFADKAGAARSHRQFHKFLDYAGPGLGLSSCLFSMIGALVAISQSLSNQDVNPTMIYVGLGGVGVGLSLGVVRFLVRGKKFTLSIAVDAADKYNKR